MIARSVFDDDKPRLETPLQAIRRKECTNVSDMTWQKTVDKLAQKHEEYPRFKPMVGGYSRGRDLLLTRADPKAPRVNHRNGWALSPSRSPEPRKRQVPQPEAEEDARPELSDEVKESLVRWGAEEHLSIDDGQSVTSTQYDDDGQPIRKLPDYMVAHPDPEHDVLVSPRDERRTPLSRYTRAQTNQAPRSHGMEENILAPAWLSAPVAGLLVTAIL